VEVQRTLRTTFAICLAAAMVAFVVLAAAFGWRAGAALAAGLLIGSANGFLADRTQRLGAFRMLSLARLAALSTAGVGIGYLLGVAAIWLVVVGLALAQLALSAAAIRELVAHR
jgi:prepilin signal peptidase PulO-like enzyme (type II secretory pathway)